MKNDLSYNAMFIGIEEDLCQLDFLDELPQGGYKSLTPCEAPDRALGHEFVSERKKP